MENKKPKAEASSRFGSSVGSSRPTGSYRTPPAGSYRSRPGYQAGQRRPTGFGSVSAPKEAPRPETDAEKKEKKRLEKRLQKEQKRLDRQEADRRPVRREKKSRRGLKALLIAVCGVLVLLLAVVLIFGNGTDGYHQLPTITRQEETESPTAAPEVTP